MDAQEIFNKAYFGVLAQGGSSFDAMNGGCRYRSTVDGQPRACGVGHVLSDEVATYLDGMTTSAIDHAIRYRNNIKKVKFPEELVEHGRLLKDIQRAHDNATGGWYNPDLDGDFLVNFTSDMRLIAAEHSLSFPEGNVE